MAENPLLSNLVFAWGGDESAIPEHEIEPFPDETRSPLLNDLIRLARRYVAGMSGATDFVWGMQKTMPALRRCLWDHRQLVPDLQLTPEQNGLAQEADKALYDLLDALAEMVYSFTKEDLPRVEAGIDLCKKAAVILEKWHGELTRLERREFGTVCQQCGHYAQPLQPECLYCKNPLPPEGEPYEPDKDWVVTPNLYAEIYEGLFATVTKEESPEPWLQRVKQVRQGFARLKVSLHQLIALKDEILEVRPAVVSQIEELLKAVEVSLASLGVLLHFPIDQDFALVDEAWYRLIDNVPVLHHNAFECKHSLMRLLDYFASEEYHAILEAAALELEQVVEGS